jgi:DeoR family transcriptional regulator of aga operon
MRNPSEDKASLRSGTILRILQKNGSVSIHDLCHELGVSMATMRRDLSALEEQNLLRRTHGGATLIEPLFYEPFRLDSSFQEQLGRCHEEKRRIALAAAELVADGDTIATTAGTTTMLVTRNIRQKRGVKVVTNTINVAMELSQRKDIDVFVTGGHLRGAWFSLVGTTATNALSRMFLDKAFIGANGIDAEKGLTCFSQEEADVNQTIVRQARQKIAVADHTKLGVVASSLICGIPEIDILITDTGATDEMVRPFTARGLKVVRV